MEPAVLVEIDEVRDVRAADLREHARFLAKPAQQLGVAAISGLSSLIATFGAAGDIARFPDLAHRADAELLDELEASERHADGRRDARTGASISCSVARRPAPAAASIRRTSSHERGPRIGIRGSRVADERDEIVAGDLRLAVVANSSSSAPIA